MPHQPFAAHAKYRKLHPPGSATQDTTAQTAANENVTSVVVRNGPALSVSSTFHDERHPQSEDERTLQHSRGTPGSSGSSEVSLLVSNGGYSHPGGATSVTTLSPHASNANSPAPSHARSIAEANAWALLLGHSPPQTIDTHRTTQMQLLSDFLEMHFPSKAAKASLKSRRSFLMGLPDIDFESVPLLRGAVEAICYAHAGSNYHDDRLVRASQQAYGKVLHSLVRTLNDTTGQKDARVIVSSILLLAMYDDSLPQAQASGWKAHYWGVHEFLRAAGPSVFSMADPFSRLLFLNLRIPIMFLGIARRKAVVLGEPKWQDVAYAAGVGGTAGGRLYARGLRIPALLERADDLVHRKDGSDSARRLVRDILALRAELVSWSVMESSFADKTNKHCETILTSDDDRFDLNFEEHLVMSSNSTFESLLDFSSFDLAVHFDMYWMFSLILDCTLLRIVHFLPSTAGLIQPRPQAEIERDAATRAKYLCRSTYFWSKSPSQGNKAFMDALLAIAESFFTEIGASKELGWCQALRVAVRMHIARLRDEQPKTLCRVGDMVADLAESTRFTSRTAGSNG